MLGAVACPVRVQRAAAGGLASALVTGVADWRRCRSCCLPISAVTMTRMTTVITDEPRATTRAMLETCGSAGKGMKEGAPSRMMIES